MRLVEIWRYPVKSMRGERLSAAELRTGGIPGDRSLHVVDAGGRLLTARTRHALLTCSATYERDRVLVEGQPWESSAAAAHVRSAAGEDARLAASEGGHRFDDTPLLVATDGALAWLGEDRRRFRPNLVIEGVDGLAERSWPGSSLRIGAALVSAQWVCKRCVITTLDPDTTEVEASVLRRIDTELDGLFALSCGVEEPGQVTAGDPVELVPRKRPATGGLAPGKAAIQAVAGGSSQ